MDPETARARKVNESLRVSISTANESVDLGVQLVSKLRDQGHRLRQTSDRLLPISGLSEQSNRFMSLIMSAMNSGRRLFFFLAILTIIILWLVIRWKSSK
jgi:hypothetical protein